MHITMPRPDNSIYLTSDAAKALGVTKATLHQMVRDGRLPKPTVVSKRARWDRLAVDKLVRERNNPCDGRLNTSDAARALGVTRQTLYNMGWTGRMRPPVSVNGRSYWDVTSVRDKDSDDIVHKLVMLINDNPYEALPGLAEKLRGLNQNDRRDVLEHCKTYGVKGLAR